MKKYVRDDTATSLKTEKKGNLNNRGDGSEYNKLNRHRIYVIYLVMRS